MPTSSPALDLGLQTLGEVLQLTPAPSALKAIISTSQNILQIINAEKTGNQEEQRLAQVILDVAVSYSDGVKKLDDNVCKDPDIERISNNLYRCLESISKALMDRPKSGFFARLLTQSATRQRIKGWEEDLDHISSVLALQIQFRSIKISQAISSESDKAVTEGISAMEERVNQAHQEALELIKSEVLKKTRQKLHKSSFGHFAPATSPIFYGRSDQVGWLVESLVQVPAYHTILGTGGIGKTSLALNMLHDPRIVEVYGKHRYFLACETTLDAAGIIAGLADIFSLNEGAFVKQFKDLCEVIKSNILFLLDNFETPWERKEARQQVEDLLLDLSSIPNLSIVITLRGAERPCGIRWSLPFFPVLGPLDLDAACQTFVTISDIAHDDPDLPRLMEAVEFIPLAITLLAAQASYSSCAFLLEQWQSCKTSMVTLGWDSRLSSLDVSISLSLNSSRFTSNRQALSLLQILSLVPDGATMEELRQMTPDDVDVHKSVSTLLQVALASIPNDRARVLAPVQEYVQLKHPITPAMLRPVLSYHAKLSRYARLSECTVEAKNVDAKLTACIGNIHCVIRICLNVESLADEALRACIDVSRFRQFSRHGAIGQLLEESVNVARDRQKPALLAELLEKLGLRMWYNSISRAASSFGRLEESVKILRGLPETSENCDILVSALNSLSWYMLAMRRPEEAIQIAQEAVNALSASTSPTNKAVAYMRLGSGLADAGRFSESRYYLELAESSFDSSSSPLLGYLLWEIYAFIYLRRDMYKQSLRAAEMGLSLPAMIDSDMRRGRLLHDRGTLLSAMGSFSDSRRDFGDAIQCLASSGSVSDLAEVYCRLGLAYLACGDVEDAQLSAQIASQFHQTAPVDAKLTLATLGLYQNHLDQSVLYLDLSVKELAISGFPVTSFPHLFRRIIRCQVQIRQRAVESLSSCILAVIFAHTYQDRATLARCILVLGDAYFFIQKDVSASKSCYLANLDLVRYLGNWRYVANALLRIGVTDYLQGDPALAVRRLNQAVRFYQETSGKLWVDMCERVLRAIEIGASIDDIPIFLPVTSHGF